VHLVALADAGAEVTKPVDAGACMISWQAKPYSELMSNSMLVFAQTVTELPWSCSRSLGVCTRHISGALLMGCVWFSGGLTNFLLPNIFPKEPLRA